MNCQFPLICFHCQLHHFLEHASLGLNPPHSCKLSQFLLEEIQSFLFQGLLPTWVKSLSHRSGAGEGDRGVLLSEGHTCISRWALDRGSRTAAPRSPWLAFFSVVLLLMSWGKGDQGPRYSEALCPGSLHPWFRARWKKGTPISQSCSATGT